MFASPIVLALFFLLAVADLIAGVANDAVNFTNSAVGSQVASRRTILLVAALGLLAGALLSAGMMDVARKGVFHPELLDYTEVTTIFLAVMLTDVLLLDLYNTFALPTSTTVSLVFELLGAAFAVAAFKVLAAGRGLEAVSTYLNADRALAMIAAIFVSVAVAFLAGLVVQFFSRLLFSFREGSRGRRWAPAWCGLATAFLLHYTVIKGLKGAAPVFGKGMDLLRERADLVAFVAFLACWALFEWLQRRRGQDVFRYVILAGTFALALAFAANDLVNFIGVPLAGLAAWRLGPAGSGESTMAGLGGAPPAEPLLLLLAAAVMIGTLAFSRKAHGVTRTELDLARQAGDRAGRAPTPIARTLVELGTAVGRGLRTLAPPPLRRWIDRRYLAEPPDDGAADFDRVRASVNLLVAASLISVGTRFKLPLSTTYVTFMAATGSALADRAWGRGTAAGRVDGVLTVVGGWLLTALIAFVGAALLATLMRWGGAPAIVVLVSLTGFALLRSHLAFPRRGGVHRR